MSARKSERIMNLTICLLMARRFIPREKIRESVEGYAGLADAAFERMFERDKDELRALGVPVEIGSNSALFPDEVGYRIRRADFELPPLEFDAAETAVLGLASGVWDSARLAGSTLSALAKLRAAGIDPDAGRVARFAPSLSAREPAFDVLWAAALHRVPVAFRYRDVDRVVEPWTVANRRGAWYLVGYDRTRAAGRSFKLARIVGQPRHAGTPDSYTVPDASVVAAQLASLEPRASDAEALVAVREGAAGELTRGGEPLAEPADLPGYRLWRVKVGPDAVGELASHGPDVVVVDPHSLVVAVREHLAEVAARWR